MTLTAKGVNAAGQTVDEVEVLRSGDLVQGEWSIQRRVREPIHGSTVDAELPVSAEAHSDRLVR